MRRAARAALGAGQPGAERIPNGAAKSDLRNELRLADEDLKRAIAEYERCLARYNRLKESVSGVRASQELKKMSLVGYAIVGSFEDGARFAVN